MSKEKKFSNAELGVLLNIVCHEHERKLHWSGPRGYAPSLVTERLIRNKVCSSEYTFNWDKDFSYPELVNPYLSTKAGVKTAIYQLAKDKLIDVIKFHGGVRLLPTAAAIDVLVKHELIEKTPVLTAYRDGLEEDRKSFQLLPADAVKYEPEIRLQMSTANDILTRKLGKDNPAVNAILEEMKAVEKAARAIP